MVNYNCKQCNRNFKKKYNYNKHINRKYPCKPVITIVFNCKFCDKNYSTKGNLKRHEEKCNKNESCGSNNDNIYNTLKSSNTNSGCICNYCNQTFTLVQNLQRHFKNRCIVKKQVDSAKKEIYMDLINNLQVENTKLKDELKITKNMPVSQSTININNNISNNINNTINNFTNNTNNTINIQLVAFGSEDKSLISNSEIFGLLKKGFKCVPELVKLLYFDENKPENHNIYIPSISRNYVMIYDGENWGLKDKEDTVENIFNDGRDFLVIKRDEFEDMLDEKYKKRLQKFDRFDNEIDVAEPKRNEILDDIKLILYNKKNMVLKTKQKNEQNE
jgi:hypothetical protein